MRILYFLAVLLWLSTTVVAQVLDPEKGDLVGGTFRLAYAEHPEDPIVFSLKVATSPEGQAVRKSIASIWDVPPYIVDIETFQFEQWRKAIDHTHDTDIEHAGIIRSPVGYSICKADHSSPEVSAGSTMNLRIQRDPQDNGLGFYITVPKPHPFQGGEDAGISLTIVFVKAQSEIWNKYASKCQPTNLLIVECKGKDCKTPRIWRPGT